MAVWLAGAGALDDGGELGANLSGDRGEFGVLDQREHPFGVDCGDVRLAAGAVDDDVAGEQRAELGLRAQGAVGVIYLVVALARRPGQGTRAVSEDPVEILRRRYARGEVGRDEYERMRRDLAA